MEMHACKLKALEFDMDTNKTKRWLTPLASAMSLLLMTSPSNAVMHQLDDRSLSEETGQAAFYTAYNAPSGGGSGTTPSDFGFFTLGLNGTIELNANINHLQLGCGGVKGPGCDIDINNLGLSGNPDGGSGPGHYAVGTSRASTDAVFTNPFIQLAIKNPTSLSTRELVGFNLGAAQVNGLITAGTDNPVSRNGAATSPKGVGINTLSGYLQLAPATGTAFTAAQIISYDGANTPSTQAFGSTVPTNQPTTGTNTPISGNIENVSGFNCSSGSGCTPFTSTNYNLQLPSTAVALSTPVTNVNGSRLTAVTLVGNGVVADLPFTGHMTASAAGFNLAENIVSPSLIRGLLANLTVNEGLSYIHNIIVDNPLSLSLQSTQILYPGAACPGGVAAGGSSCNIAQPGWWMAFGGQVNVGSISPAVQVDIPLQALQQTLVATSNYITANPIDCGPPGILSCFGGSIAVGTVDLSPTSSTPANPLSIGLSNLTLSAQTPSRNCYGGLKFC